MCNRKRQSQQKQQKEQYTPINPVAATPVPGPEDPLMVRHDRPYIYHNFTNSLCPTCLKVIQAKVILQNNKVYMLKTCPEHGAYVHCSHRMPPTI